LFLPAQDKILDICGILKADTYINAIGGQELYDKTEFHNKGINLKFLLSDATPYKQFKNDFIPNLSIIDILMFNSREEINYMLNNFKLM
jgi:hypothetical protein